LNAAGHAVLGVAVVGDELFVERAVAPSAQARHHDRPVIGHRDRRRPPQSRQRAGRCEARRRHAEIDRPRFDRIPPGERGVELLREIRRRLVQAVVVGLNDPRAELLVRLERQAISCRLSRRDRALRACLVAHRGAGALFLDGADPTEEQRFSLAHELAHFLRDYLEPRHRAVDVFGPGVLQVFDGVRPPTLEERVSALLADVPIGFHVHLMERTAEGQFASAAIDTAERDADLLAFELLAPSARVLDTFDLGGHEGRHTRLTELLIGTYGLPIRVAAQYAALLAPPGRSTSFLSRLRPVP